MDKMYDMDIVMDMANLVMDMANSNLRRFPDCCIYNLCKKRIK